jgi:hypothetical protein
VVYGDIYAIDFTGKNSVRLTKDAPQATYEMNWAPVWWMPISRN